MSEPRGSDYRVKAEHPRRPGQPLRITNKDGGFIAESGQTCDHVAADDLASMIANGYVELVEHHAHKAHPAKAKGGA